MPTPSTYQLNLPPRVPRAQQPLPEPKDKFYSPEIDDLSDFLCIPRQAARRVFAICEVQ